MADKVLRARCEERLALLRLPHRFTQAQLIKAAEDFVGLPIVTQPTDTRGRKWCGVRTRRADREDIEYDPATSLLHQLHIVAHEISHIVFGHKGIVDLADTPSDEELAAQMDWSVLGLSFRAAYDTEEEREAELLARIIRHRVYRNREIPPLRPVTAEDRWEAAFTRPIKERRS